MDDDIVTVKLRIDRYCMDDDDYHTFIYQRFTYPACLAKSPVLSKQLKEAGDGVLDRSEFDYNPLEEVIRFLNTGVTRWIYAEFDEEEGDLGTELDLAFETYILAYKFKIESLQNALVDEVLSYMAENRFTIEYLERFCDKAAPDAPLLRLLVSQLAYGVKLGDKGRYAGC